MKKLLFLAVVAPISLLTLFVSTPAKAESNQISFSVGIVARTSTDTINDFDLSQINPDLYALKLVQTKELAYSK